VQIISKQKTVPSIYKQKATDGSLPCKKGITSNIFEKLSIHYYFNMSNKNMNKAVK